ncbi:MULTISPECIES: hypothetical protein [unclassified Acinetobacter]|uniref:hypothetical protein n=1 Tax=unclassified Acinetobacter TaxID=196816 RepID=UPI0025757F34|nr:MULTISPECIES: hypothetical protein [unclassified Acinetobacter]MDM1764574.1 hypothetical protein [Acinetobacter sp. 226-1]MDM1767549.1 hypothetical protein [Acinetobacter sp. 226-4]
MKSLLIIFFLIFSIRHSYAATDTEFCKTVAQQAEAIMAMRQSDVEKKVLYEKIKYKGPEVAIILEAIIIDAYETPKLKSLNAQKQAMHEFSNQWFLRCLKA